MSQRPTMRVWVVIGDYSRWLAGRGDVAAARRAGYRVHRYDLHRPRKAKKAKRDDLESKRAAMRRQATAPVTNRFIGGPRRSRRAKEVKR